MNQFFSDRLVPIPNSEGGSLVFSPPSNMAKLPPAQIPDGASAMIVTTQVPDNRKISFDGVGTVAFSLAANSAFSSASPLILGRSMIEAAGFGNGSTWYIQFFRTS